MNKTRLIAELLLPATLGFSAAGCFSTATSTPYGDLYDYTHRADGYAFSDPYGYAFPNEGYYPYYPYFIYGDGDHDCDDGFCGRHHDRDPEVTNTSRAAALHEPFAGAGRERSMEHGFESGEMRGGHSTRR
jgi:hypothetical protein